jgi:hypothetical protein
MSPEQFGEPLARSIESSVLGFYGRDLRSDLPRNADRVVRSGMWFGKNWRWPFGQDSEFSS